MSKPKNQNRTFHLLQKADILTCYEHKITQPQSGGRRFFLDTAQLPASVIVLPPTKLEFGKCPVGENPNPGHSRGKLLHRLDQQAVAVEPITYKAIVRSAPADWP